MGQSARKEIMTILQLCMRPLEKVGAKCVA